MYLIAAFYRFVAIDDAAGIVNQLRIDLARLDLRGTLLIAPEGINGTMAGEPEAMDSLLHLLGDRFGLLREDVKFAEQPTWPFKRLKVRLKKEIITFKQPSAAPSLQVGIYVSPAEWNNLIADPDLLLLDTRNKYETEMGTFRGAVVPSISYFTEFADYVRHSLADKKHKKVAMYCTGGIRCEKASAFMLAEGFSQVYHLKGGILKYIQEMPVAQSCWQGKCFVFDQRISVERTDLISL
jgi:UPF0176 protein